MDNRRKDREICFSRVEINGIPVQLRNINSGGIKVFLIQDTDLTQNKEIKIRVFPHKDTGIADFNIKAEVKWKTVEKSGTSAGFQFYREEEDSIKKKIELLITYYEKKIG